MITSIIQGHLDVLLYLLAIKADPNILDNNSFTPLHWAAIKVLCRQHMQYLLTRLLTF